MYAPTQAEEQTASDIAHRVRVERYGQSPGVIAQAVASEMLDEGFRQSRLPADVTALLARARESSETLHSADRHPEDVLLIAELASELAAAQPSTESGPEGAGGAGHRFEWFNPRTGTAYRRVEPERFGYQYVTTAAGSRYLIRAGSVQLRHTASRTPAPV